MMIRTNPKLMYNRRKLLLLAAKRGVPNAGGGGGGGGGGAKYTPLLPLNLPMYFLTLFPVS